MLHSIFRSTLVAAFAAALVGCGDGTPVSPNPIEEPEVVFTASVMAKVDGTVDDASSRLISALGDQTFAALLNSNLDELNTRVSAGDFSGAALTLARTRAMIERTDVSQEVLDFAHDLSAVGLILDQTEALLDRAAGRS